MQKAVNPGVWRTLRSLAVTPLLAVALIVIFFLAVEIIARTSFVRSRLMPPSVGSRFRLLDQHLDQIDELYRNGVELDCIVLGNSLPLAAIDPEILRPAFRDKAGQELECYALGLPGTQPTGAAVLARVMFEDYGPWLIIYATSTRDFSLQTESAGLEGLPWLRYRAGEVSPEGWLVDHSFAYQYYLLYQAWSVPEQRRFVEYRFPITPRGWMSVHRGATFGSLEDVAPELKAPLTRQLAKGASEKQLASLAELAKLAGSKRRIVVLEMPSAPILSESLPKDSPNYDRIVARLKEETAKYGMPFWRAPADVIPDDGWVDLWHMNADGARAYSRWLGGRIADAIAAGELAGPRR